jgi:hypothetical protein
LTHLRDILVRRNLLDPHEELAPAMLEDLAHYAYFTGCVTRGDIGRLLGLTADAARQKLRQWKKWNEGNRSCSLRGNPFYEEWAAREPRGRGSKKPGVLP